jgi:hypothetical protein
VSIVTPECLHLARLPEGRDAADVRHAAVEGAAGRPRRVHYGRQIGAACGDRPATRRPATLGAKTRVRLLNPRFPMLGWRCSYRTAALATARLRSTPIHKETSHAPPPLGPGAREADGRGGARTFSRGGESARRTELWLLGARKIGILPAIDDLCGRAPSFGTPQEARHVR